VGVRRGATSVVLRHMMTICPCATAKEVDDAQLRACQVWHDNWTVVTGPGASMSTPTLAGSIDIMPMGTQLALKGCNKRSN
jgi:hypothetical protein